MAKGRRSDWKPGAGAQPAGGGMQPGMVEKIKKMQDDMAATQAALETELINVTAAGGASMLEDTLVAAVNEAILASQEHSAKRMEEVTGGVQIPGLM